MRVQPVLEQLSGLPFVTMGGALEFAALDRVPGRLPALFVVPQNKAASEAPRTSVIDQKVSVLFSTVLIISANGRDATRVSAQLEELEAAVIDRLVGWTHPDCSRETQLADAAALSVDGSAFTWGIRFRTSYHIRKAV